MWIKLLDSSLIRRYGKVEIEVDSDVGVLLISKKLAIASDVVKSLDAPPADKMMKQPEVKKDENNIFPSSIIAK